MTTFQDKVVWITGASSGIGEALAYAFAEKGTKLVLSARRLAELERVKANCSKAKSVFLLPLDLNKVNELSDKVAMVLKEYGHIDILLNNGGISQRSFAWDTSLEVYRNILEVNFFGTIVLSNTVLTHFLEKNAGHLVTVSSIAGKVGLPLRTAYCASKHALQGFFEALRAEISEKNINILLVCPGSVKTNIAKNALKGDGSAFNKADRNIDAGIPPEQCAKEILRAIEKNKREVIIAKGREKTLVWLQRFFPKMVFNITKKLAHP